MVELFNENGKLIRCGKNLQTLRKWTGKVYAAQVHIHLLTEGRGRLWVRFTGVSAKTEFADFDVLRDTLKRWRNLYNTPLYINGQPCGIVSHRNIHLQSPRIQAERKAGIDAKTQENQSRV